jgi:hypothetical protein
MIQRNYDAFLEAALKGPLTDIWVDQPAYIAAAYAFKGDRQTASRYLKIFKEVFAKEIFNGRQPSPEEMVGWIHKANPLRREADFDHILEGLAIAGLERPAGAAHGQAAAETPQQEPVPANLFRKVDKLWHMTYADRSVQLPEVKGFLDLAVLLARPGVEAHCTQLMGSVLQVDDGEQVIDEQARRAYETRIRDLQEAIADAEAMNDLGRREALEAELDQLTTLLAKALGLGGKTRSVNTPVDRSRSAVTWRIRSAIRKIASVHPALGRHLSNSIRTGTFCCYGPEKEQVWKL